MGLDMYLTADKYVSGWDFRKDENFDKIVEAVGIAPVADSPSLTVSVKVGYWRKANAIHAWFVDNVQDGVDECQKSYVEPEQLQDLIDTCKSVLANPDEAENDLPSRSGFFFGGTEYDEWYEADLKRTIEICEAALALEGVDLYYQSSW